MPGVSPYGCGRHSAWQDALQILWRWRGGWGECAANDKPQLIGGLVEGVFVGLLCWFVSHICMCMYICVCAFFSTVPKHEQLRATRKLTHFLLSCDAHLSRKLA